MDPAPDRPAPDGQTEQRPDEETSQPKDEETPGPAEQDAEQPTNRDAPRPTDEDADQPMDEDAHRPTDEGADERTDGPADRRPDQPREGATGERGSGQTSNEADPLLQELVAYLRERRTELREEWARRISEAELLGVMSDEEIFSEATEVYDNYVDALETGSIETLESYARELSERIIPRGVETHEVLGIVLLLRDVLARSLFAKYQKDLDLLNRILDSYEPAANRIAVTVGVSFVEERERVIHEQQEAMRELSTPVLQLREHLLILPIIGALDSSRARQLTEQLLGSDPRASRDGRGHRHHRGRDDRSHGGQSPRPDRRGVPADGCQHDPHRPLVRDRPDAGRPRTSTSA